jgi:hypothetical protein
MKTSDTVTNVAARELSKAHTKASLVDLHLDSVLLNRRLSEEVAALRAAAEGSNRRKFIPSVEENSFFTICLLKKGIPVKTKQPDGTARHMGETTSRYVNDGQRTKHGRYVATSTCKCGNVNIIDRTFEMRVQFGKNKTGGYWVNGKFFVEDSGETITNTKTTATGTDKDFSTSEDGTQTPTGDMPEVRNAAGVEAAEAEGQRSRTQTAGDEPTTHLPYTITK